MIFTQDLTPTLLIKVDLIVNQIGNLFYLYFVNYFNQYKKNIYSLKLIFCFALHINHSIISIKVH